MKSPGVTTLLGRITQAGAAFLLGLALIESIPTPAYAQDKPPIDQQMVNDKAKFFVRAWVDKPYGAYNEGEALTIKARCEEDAYLYVLYQQCDGKIYQIFPNKFQPDNKIQAMTDVQVPDKDDGFRFFISAPLGIEVIKVVASKKPIDALSLPELKQDHFNPITLEQLDQAGKQVSKEPANQWSEHDIKIVTVPKGQPTVPVVTKRVGVFFGVSKYQFNDIDMQVKRDAMKQAMGQVDESQVKPTNLESPINDARDMAQMFQQVGKLDECKVFVDGEASRARMEEMITQWLPSVTKPGDTVFVYYSGHGGVIPDDDGDEKDGEDETLCPSDSFGYPTFCVLQERGEAGQLDPELTLRIRRLSLLGNSIYEMALAKLGGASSPEAKAKASSAAIRFVEGESYITDDVMGNWVRKLDGRRVVIILDSCRSGGMTNLEKKPTKEPGADQKPKTKTFDFLTSEFKRLKDLNQPSLTIVAAANEPENSQEFVGARNGVFTTSVLKLLRTSAEPVDAKTAVDTATNEIKNIELLRSLAGKPGLDFLPAFFTTDPKPIYLKPPGSASKSSTPAPNKD